MCGRYTIGGRAVSAKEWRAWLSGQFQADFLETVDDDLLRGRFNVAPTEQVPLLRQASSGERVIDEARWSYLPYWAKTSKDRPQAINARDEKLGSGMWKRALDPRSRVVMIADGYYEWIKSESGDQRPAPFHHQVDQGEFFGFAAVASTTRVEDRPQPLHTVAMITTAANAVAARVHDRMPAILADPEQIAAWLSPSVSADEARQLIGPLPDHRLTVSPASRLVNSVRNQGPELLDPDRE